jgi:hypothetical protein
MMRGRKVVATGVLVLSAAVSSCMGRGGTIDRTDPSFTPNGGNGRSSSPSRRAAGHSSISQPPSPPRPSHSRLS